MPAEARNMPLAELEKKVTSVLKAQSQGEFNHQIDKAYADIKPTLDKIKSDMLLERSEKDKSEDQEKPKVLDNKEDASAKDNAKIKE